MDLLWLTSIACRDLFSVLHFAQLQFEVYNFYITYNINAKETISELKETHLLLITELHSTLVHLTTSVAKNYPTLFYAEISDETPEWCYTILCYFSISLVHVASKSKLGGIFYLFWEDRLCKKVSEISIIFQIVCFKIGLFNISKAN